MVKLELLIFVAFTALVCCSEIEDIEQKKRGTGKTTNINSIPTGAQKQDYTYNTYSSNPSLQSSSSYQSQVPNSFYPNHASSQYYSSSNTQTESPPYTTQQQPQLNSLPPPTTSQFVPLNFVPNPGYQTKFQIVPTRPNGNIQLAIYQQPNNYPSSLMPYTSQLFSSHPTNQINPHQFSLSTQGGHFNIAPNYQQLPLGGSYLGQPSTMLLVQPNLNLPYSNLLYPNPFQNLYNYHPSNTQNRLNVQYAPQGVPNEYEKLQSTIAQNNIKEDNDIGHNSEYTSPSDSSSSYKNAYSSNRNTYTKL